MRSDLEGYRRRDIEEPERPSKWTTSDVVEIGRTEWSIQNEIKITSRGKRMTAYVLCRLPKMDKSIMLTATEMGQYPLVRSGRKYHYKTEDKKNGNESD